MGNGDRTRTGPPTRPRRRSSLSPDLPKVALVFEVGPDLPKVALVSRLSLSLPKVASVFGVGPGLPKVALVSEVGPSLPKATSVSGVGPGLPKVALVSGVSHGFPRRPQSSESALISQGALSLRSWPRPSQGGSSLRGQPWLLKAVSVFGLGPSLPRWPRPQRRPPPTDSSVDHLLTNPSVGLLQRPQRRPHRLQRWPPPIDPSVGLTDSSIGLSNQLQRRPQQLTPESAPVLIPASTSSNRPQHRPHQLQCQPPLTDSSIGHLLIDPSIGLLLTNPSVTLTDSSVGLSN